MRFLLIKYTKRVVSAPLLLTASLSAGAVYAEPEPIAQPHTVEPLTEVQIAQRNRGYGMFIHFGINTFNQVEWSDGKLPISSYNPTKLDPGQWVKIAKQAGFRYIVLVTKHIDGFCLWDSKDNDYDVASSPVKTDVVAEVAKACKKHGLELGIYYSLWDRHAPSYRDPDPTVYQKYMRAHLEQLMSNYGPICELWLDGGWDKGNNDWDIPALSKLVKSLQPNCAISVNFTLHPPGKPTARHHTDDFQKEDPIRFWPVDFRLKDPEIARWDDPQLFRWHKDPAGQLRRLPFEHTICLSENWNWFQKEGIRPVRGLDELEQMFYWCTRGDGTLVLNIPPGQDGLILDHEARRAIELAERLGIVNGGPLPTEPRNQLWTSRARAIDDGAPKNENPASNAVDSSVQTYWEANSRTPTLELTCKEAIEFDQIILHEKSIPQPLHPGDKRDIFSKKHLFHVREFKIEACSEGKWTTIHRGKNIGHALKIDLPGKMKADALRLVIEQADAPPRISHIAAALKSSAGLRPVYKVAE